MDTSSVADAVALDAPHPTDSDPAADLPAADAAPAPDIGVPIPVCGDGTCQSDENCLVCATDCGACPSGVVDIWVPRPLNPQFATPGGTFVAEVRGAATLAGTGWSAALRNELRSWACTVSATFGKIDHDAEPGWRLSVTLPAGVPPELFELQLAHATAGTGSQQRAVQVVEDFEESFYVVHQTDQHMKVITPDNADGTKQAGVYRNGTVEGIKWGAKSLNLINPRFALLTGDNVQVYNSATDWDGIATNTTRVQQYIEQGLSAYQMATPATTGNHDIGWSNYDQNAAWKDVYNTIVGQRAFSYRLGSFYLLLYEWSQSEYLTWAKSDYAAAAADPKLKFRLLARHYLDGADVVTASTPPGLKVVGHDHSTYIASGTSYPVLAGPTAQNYQRSAFYQFDRTATGWACPQTATHAEGVNVFPLHGDWGTPKVTDSWQHANDGSQTANSVTVANSLPFNFWHGRVRFLMAKGSYAVTGGTVEATYDNAAGTMTAVLVRIDIPKSGAVTAAIAPK